MLKRIIRGNNPTSLLVFNLTIFSMLVVGSAFVTNWWLLLVSVVVYFCTICLGVSITFHRALTHKALKLHPLVEKIFATFGSYAGTGSPVIWTLTHRQHHRFSDQPGDPHPPTGVLNTFLGVYPRVSARGMREVVKTRYYAFLHRYYFGLIALVGFALLLISFDALYFGLVVPTFMAITASNVLNWYGHTKGLIGYRNYALTDNSQNNAACGVLIFGEGWHNNHHRFPGSANFGIRRHEVDVSFYVIKFLERLGLATAVREANDNR